MKVKVCGIDPSLRNFGMVKMMLDIETLGLELVDMKLTETDKQTGKVVRQNSDDMRRCREQYQAYVEFAKDCALAFVEIPQGAQSARAMLSNGCVYGLIAACPIPIIEVQPTETKLATVGTKVASKEEMIEWAGETYPDAPWLKHKSKGQMVLTAKNEHLADATAIVHAGIKTADFNRFLAILRLSNSQDKYQGEKVISA